MHLMDDAICKSTQDIWTSILGLPIQRRSYEETSDGRRGDLIGFVRITGAWEGTLAFYCPSELVRQAAAIMFHLDPENVSTHEMHDVLGELANMTVGNIKSLLPNPSYLSCPAVTETTVSPIRSTGYRTVCQVLFICQGYPLKVVLLEQNKNNDKKTQPSRQAANGR